MFSTYSGNLSTILRHFNQVVPFYASVYFSTFQREISPFTPLQYLTDTVALQIKISYEI